MENNDLNIEVEKTLASLDEVSRAETSSGFDKQLAQNISFLPRQKRLRWIQYSAAAMVVMALLNIGMILTLSNQETTLEVNEEFSGEAFLYQTIDYLELE